WWGEGGEGADGGRGRNRAHVDADNLPQCFRSRSPTQPQVRSRYGVVATPGERVAAADALDSHPGSLDPPVPLDRLVSVLGARREIPAAASERAQEGGQRDLVAADQAQDDPGHVPGSASRPSTRAASSDSAWSGSSSAAGRPTRTTS